MVVLVTPNFTVQRPSKYPECIFSNDWCSVNYATVEEAGKSIVRKQELYNSYLNKMLDLSFYFTIHHACIKRELTDFYCLTPLVSG